MKIININEQRNKNNGYVTTTYDLDERITNMNLLLGVLRAFETDRIKMTDCMCTSYVDEGHTERKHFYNYADMVEASDKFKDYSQFAANYIDSFDERYAYDVVVFADANKIDKVVNPNKITKDEGRARKI